MKRILWIGALMTSLGALVSAHDDAHDDVSCQRANVPVALAPGQPARYTLSGELCATQDERRAGTTVQLLLHGATYSHEFWDFGRIDGIRYSYARDVAARGFPTFALDEIGAGNSSHPASDQLTIDAVAYVTHQVVQALRNGSLVRVPFGSVITVGHSLGSVVAWDEAITYADVDGVIVTGAAHSLSSRFQEAVPRPFHPANQDSKFAHDGLDAGYLTTMPGVRGVFFSAPDASPAVMSEDEALKDVVPATELGTGMPLVLSTATQAIQVPVLIILGSDDMTTCGPGPHGRIFDCSSGAVVVAQEAPFYSAQARIHACVLPASGHDLSLAMNHRLQVADAVAWSSAFVGQVRIPDKYDVAHRHDVDDDDTGLAWNDSLPWNCR